MNGALLGFTIILLLAAVFQIATVAIGIQCFDLPTHSVFKEEKKNNYNFLLSQVVFGILMVFLSFLGIYLSF